MKKENKKMAQERRAAERKRQERMKLLKTILIVVVVIGFFAGMIGYGIWDSKNAKQEETQTSQESGTTEEVTKPAYDTDTTREVKNGDTVNIDYSGSIDGFVFDGGTAEGQRLTIGSHSFIDDFEEQLEGHKIGETVEVNVTFPEDYGRSYTDDSGEVKSFNGAEAVFTVKINGIYE